LALTAISAITTVISHVDIGTLGSVIGHGLMNLGWGTILNG
jgi:hypothetical protein